MEENSLCKLICLNYVKNSTNVDKDLDEPRYFEWNVMHFVKMHGLSAPKK